MMIFFDIDETLLNQRHAEAVAAEGVLRTYGHALPADCSASDFCRVWRDLREKHLPDFLNGTISYREHHRRRIREIFSDGPDLSDREADERYGLFFDAYRSAWRLFDDVLPSLDALSRYPLGILSNGNARQQRLKLERTGILDRFSVIVISQEVGAGKPSQDVFLAGCARAGRNPEECVHVGDRLEADAGASCAAGLRGIWLDRHRSNLNAGVEVIHSLAELATRLHLVERRNRDLVPGRFAPEQQEHAQAVSGRFQNASATLEEGGQ